MVWKHELAYKRSLLSDQKPLEIDFPQYQQKPFIPDTTTDGYIGKRKPDGKAWSKKYGNKIRFQAGYDLASR